MKSGSMGDSGTSGGVVLYESDDGKLKINVKLEAETVWLSQQQLAELFQTSKQLISHHIGIFLMREN